MGSFHSFCRSKSEEVTILLVGLSNAGKTEMVKRILKKRRAKTLISKYITNFKFKMRKFEINLLEISDNEVMREMWPFYFAQASAVIFVADISDFTTIEQSRLMFTEMMKHKYIRRKPIVIYANKEEDNPDFDYGNFDEYFGCSELACQADSYRALQICGKKYKREIIPGFKWLLEQIRKEERYLTNRVDFDVNEQTSVSMKTTSERRRSI